ADAATTSLSWTQPGSLVFSPPTAAFSLQYGFGRSSLPPLTATVQVNNNGNAPVVISSYSLTVVDGGGYPSSLFSVANAPRTPFSILPGAAVAIGIRARQGDVPSSAVRSAFAILQLDCSALSGCTLPVELVVTDVPPPGSGGGGGDEG
ncbi:hypothetical protein GWI34_43490, partial [Actinomadura sp. DSM 109109]|nr:hypothetical protein [Actinomadura lepetitiana]